MRQTDDGLLSVGAADERLNFACIKWQGASPHSTSADLVQPLQAYRKIQYAVRIQL